MFRDVTETIALTALLLYASAIYQSVSEFGIYLILPELLLLVGGAICWLLIWRALH